MKKIVPIIMVCIVTLSFTGIGCGILTDKDRLVIAEVNEEEILRSDLRKLLYDMDDEERPIIQTRADLVKVLDKHIDTIILSEVSTVLRDEGKIEMPREMGEEIYFAKKPEFRNIRGMKNNVDMDLTEGQLRAMEAQIEFGIDDEMEILYHQEALAYKVNGLITSGKANISDEEFAAEYERRKESFQTFEYIDFIAIRLPNDPGAKQEANIAYQRILNGESFDTVLESYLNFNPKFGIRSSFENNPSKIIFAPFWHNVTGCKKGDVLGPLLLPAHEQMRQGPDGQVQTVQAPESWIVLIVEEHRPPRQKTLEEAKQDMFMNLLSTQMMKNLREEYGVVTYEDNLWRPEGYGDQFKDSMIDVD